MKLKWFGVAVGLVWIWLQFSGNSKKEPLQGDWLWETQLS